MIKINLLTTFANLEADDSSFAPDDEQKQIYIDFAKRLVILLIGPLAMYFYENSQIPEFRNQIAQLSAKLAEHKQFNDKKKGLAEEIKKYEEDQTKLNAQMSFMKKVSNEKINELKLFQYLQSNTPDSVWLNKVEIKGAELTLTAETDVPADITKFLDALGNATFLISVSPLNQDTKADSMGLGITTTVFNVKANFAGGAVTQ